MIKLLLKLVTDRLDTLSRGAKRTLLREQNPHMIMNSGAGEDLFLEENQLDAEHNTFERIRHIERQIAEAAIEIAVAFDAAGGIIAVMYGQPSTVQFDWKQERRIMPDSIITHNHPYKTYFSADDVSYASRLNVSEVRAVAGNQVHRMARPPDGWTVCGFKELYNSEMRKIDHRINQGKISREQTKREFLALPEKCAKALSLFTQPDTL